MLTLPARSVSAALLRRLPAVAREARVHSVFARACNVELEHGLLLTVAPSAAGNLPGGLLLTEAHWAAFAANAPAPGDAVGLSASAISFPGRAMALLLTGAPLWQPALTVGRVVDQGTLTTRLEGATAFFAPGALGPTDSAALVEAAGWRLGPALAAGDRTAIEGAVAGLVGLGPGLTPAGDDFLVGALLAEQVLAASGDMKGPARSRRLLAEAVARQAHRTTDIARSYLLYAVEGAFAEVPLGFARGLLTQEEGWREWAPRLRALGATSGRDLARGVLATLGVNEL